MSVGEFLDTEDGGFVPDVPAPQTEQTPCFGWIDVTVWEPRLSWPCLFH